MTSNASTLCKPCQVLLLPGMFILQATSILRRRVDSSASVPLPAGATTLEHGTRDYYRIEDESGKRYWLYREGLYRPDRAPQWYLHGFFA